MVGVISWEQTEYYDASSHDGDMAGGGELSGSATYATIERYRVR